MINDRMDNLIGKLQSIKMTAEEKEAVYNRALISIEKIESIHHEEIKTPVKSTFISAWYSYVQERKFIPALSVFGILLITGGASLFAESSLPGDSLYSIKVNLNENVRGLAAVTPEAKAKFALEITDKRLQEAAILSTRGQLNAENSEIVRQQILKQVGQVKNQVASLASTNNLKAAQSIAVNFESSLKAHELILEKISKDQSATSSNQLALASNKEHISSILSTVKTELATTTEARVTLEAQDLADASKEKVEARFSELKLQVLEIKLLSNTSSISTTTASTSAYLITQVDMLTDLADKNIKDGAYPTALAIIQRTAQLISDIEAIINADSSAEFDLKAIINEALSGNSINFDVTAGSKPADTNNSTGSVSTSTDATSTSSTSGASSATSTTAINIATSTILY